MRTIYATLIILLIPCFISTACSRSYKKRDRLSAALTAAAEAIALSGKFSAVAVNRLSLQKTSCYPLTNIKVEKAGDALDISESEGRTTASIIDEDLIRIEVDRQSAGREGVINFTIHQTTPGELEACDANYYLLDTDSEEDPTSKSHDYILVGGEILVDSYNEEFVDGFINSGEYFLTFTTPEGLTFPVEGSYYTRSGSGQRLP